MLASLATTARYLVPARVRSGVKQTGRKLARRVFRRPYAVIDSLAERINLLERANADLQHQLASVARRQDGLHDDVQLTLAFGWDYVALVRRVAALEDRSLAADRDATPRPARAIDPARSDAA